MRAMGLENDRECYLDIQSSVHDLVSRVGMQFDVPYNKQPPAQLGKLFKLTRRRHPCLENFENDWPVAEMVKQYLQNKRKAKSLKRKAEHTSDMSEGGRTAKRSRFDDFDDEEEDEQLDDGRRGSGEDDDVNGDEED
ncbi:hypothetical protein HYDPIDRAFT_110112 [Hydnomerulius pinastri MD-312]|nr:hypothetical protein HYDPIDRAFT_110112 [Hydnomerulius pinastri MD-312]